MKKRILLVDDEEHVRKIYMRLFDSCVRSVLDVTEAGSAEEALDYLIRRDYDMVMLDIRMPNVCGQEFFGIVKELDPKMKILVASVFSVEQQKKLVPVADDYFDKSKGPFQLLEKVSGMLLRT